MQSELKCLSEYHSNITKEFHLIVNLLALLHKKLPMENGQMLMPTSFLVQRTLMVSMVLQPGAGATASAVLQRLSDMPSLASAFKTCGDCH